MENFPMTQREVYNQLHLEYRMRIAFRYCTPDAPEDFLDKAEREATKHAIQEAWYWFNNQKEFIGKCFYVSNAMQLAAEGYRQ